MDRCVRDGVPWCFVDRRRVRLDTLWLGEGIFGRVFGGGILGTEENVSEFPSVCACVCGG